MTENSKIEWTDHTFNPWIGCTKISPGCDHCYAERTARRFGTLWGPHAERRTTSEAYWKQPLRWNAKAAKTGEIVRVFCASMADIFDVDAPAGARDRFWNLVRATPHLTYLLLTKRIGNAARMLPPDWGDGYPNVWLMATVVNQSEFDRDVRKLLAIPAVKHGLSIEPMLGPIDTDGLLDDLVEDEDGAPYPGRVDWIICGGESGHGARPMHPEWARTLRDQCAAAGVAFFFKQWGEWEPVGPIYSDDDTHEHLAAMDVQDEGHAAELLLTPTRGRCFVRVDGQPPQGTWAMRRVGKAAAGRLLDGREHSAFPEAA